jgi:opacity protein-like surface antigen
MACAANAEGNRMSKTLCLLAVLLALANPASAQELTPAGDISGGYAFLRDNDLEENLHGWMVSVAGNLSRVFGIVGEVGGNSKTYEYLGTDVDLAVYSFMGGARFSARTPRVTPFGQFLLGGARASVSVLGETESTTEFAIQPGGGVDVWLTPRFAIRAGADYRYIFAEEEGSDEFRFYAGVTFAFGER